MSRYFFFPLCILFCFPIIAEEWQLLGKSEKDNSLDINTIRVSQSEIFNKIQIRILDHPIQLFDLKVHFRNRSVYNVSIQKSFSSGESSKIINLPNEERFIDYVKIKHRTTNFLFQKATLQLWGIKRSDQSNQYSTNDAQNKINPPPKKDKYLVSKQWEYIGSKNINRDQDYDVINIDKKENSFKTVRLQVTESALFLKDYRIVFTNEEQIKKTVGTLIAENSYTNTLDLSEYNQAIQKVILRYSSIKQKKVKVHLWGSQQFFNSNTQSSRRDHRSSKRDGNRKKPPKRDHNRQLSDHNRDHQFSQRDRNHDNQSSKHNSDRQPSKRKRNRLSKHERDRDHRFSLRERKREREQERDNNSISNERSVDQWELLGKRKVDSAKNLGVIYARAAKKFTKKIQFRVSGQDLEIKDFKIFFENGQFMNLSVRKLILQGGTFVKDFPPNKGTIDRIQFSYKSKKNFFDSQQEAIIEAWVK